MTQIINYSDKAIAVIGDTKAIKDSLKALGGRFNFRLTCGAGWIFPKTKLEDVQKLLDCGEVVSNAVAKVVDISKQYKDALDEYSKLRPYDYDAKKLFIGAIKLNGGYVMIDKDDITTTFWFHDEGPNYDYYKEVTKSEDSKKRYFIAKNKGYIEGLIKDLKEDKQFYFKPVNKYNRVTYYRNAYDWQDKQEVNDVEITKEQRDILIKAFEWRLSQLEKRLQTYLKRFGVSKLHFGTYWADR